MTAETCKAVNQAEPHETFCKTNRSQSTLQAWHAIIQEPELEISIDCKDKKNYSNKWIKLVQKEHATVPSIRQIKTLSRNSMGYQWKYTTIPNISNEETWLFSPSLLHYSDKLFIWHGNTW
jgi:hypothetical protein